MGVGIRSLHNSVQQPRKSGSLVEMGRVWMVGAQGLRKGRPLSLPGIWPFEPSLHRFPPGSGGGEGRQKLRCGVGVADALRGFSQPEGSPPCPLPPPATLSPRLGSGRGSSRGALGQGCKACPSVDSNFCYETELRKLHTTPTAMVPFLRLNLAETTTKVWAQ